MNEHAIEHVARCWLEARLLRLGFQVARPAYDRGIDLIVFLDDPLAPFHAIPVQIKAATERRFNVHRSLCNRGIVMAYIWYALSDSPALYLVAHDEALLLPPVVDQNGASWVTRGEWNDSWVGQPRQQALTPYLDNFAALSRPSISN